MRNIAFRTSWIRLLSCVIGALVLLLAIECGLRPAPKQAILLLLDAARADRFSCYGYDRPTTPHFDSLAAHGWLFENHFTHDTDTRSALPPLFYSRYFAKPIFPLSPGIPMEDPENLFRDNDEECMSLPGILSLAGYRTIAISAHPWITGGTELAGEFHKMIDPSDFPKARGRMPNAREMVDHAIDWIEHNRIRDYFLYVHLMDTHFPHTYEKDAEVLAGSSRAGEHRFDEHGRPRQLGQELSPAQRRYLDAMYDGSLRFADRAIGRLVAHLRTNDHLKNSLIIITSDHGEHLLEHTGRFEHGGPWYDTLARVPLIISYGEQIEPNRIHRMTGAVDLLPTILKLLDVPIPSGIHPDGTDLSTLIHRGKAESHALMYKGVRSFTHKLLIDNWRYALGHDGPVGVHQLRGRLYDLSEDPNELVDVWSTNEGKVGELADLYRAALREKYERFMNAISDRQPRSAFAIAAKNFSVHPEPLTVSAELNIDAYRSSRTEREWILSNHWEDFWLLGHAETGPATISIPMPNGRYRVSAAMAGQCTVAVNGCHETFLRGLLVTAGEEVKCRPQSTGEITIEDEQLRVTLKPRIGEGWVLFRHFGFEPVIDDAQHLDDEALNRLRALGYLN